jgi:hypothetical protein
MVFMDVLLDRLREARVDWQTTSESPYVFQTIYHEKVVRLRLNDFPDEPLCTVIIDGAEIDLHEFSKAWTLPRHRGEGR